MFIFCLFLGMTFLILGMVSIIRKNYYCIGEFFCSFLFILLSVLFYPLDAPLSLVSQSSYELIERQSGLYFADSNGEIKSLEVIDKEDIKYIESEEFEVVVKRYETPTYFGASRKETKYEVYLNLDETDDLKEALSVKDPAYEVIMTNGSYYNETDNGYSIRYIEDSLVKEIEISKDNLKITKSDSGEAALVKINSQFEILLP